MDLKPLAEGLARLVGGSQPVAQKLAEEAALTLANHWNHFARVSSRRTLFKVYKVANGKARVQMDPLYVVDAGELVDLSLHNLRQPLLREQHKTVGPSAGTALAVVAAEIARTREAHFWSKQQAFQVARLSPEVNSDLHKALTSKSWVPVRSAVDPSYGAAEEVDASFFNIGFRIRVLLDVEAGSERASRIAETLGRRRASRRSR